ILQEYHFLPIDQRKLFLDECCLYSLKLLITQVCSDSLTLFQRLIMDKSKHTTKPCLGIRKPGRMWYRISRRQLMIQALRVRIQDPFFVAG
ncbi:unnamed protein product, partial [Acanthoscelides obtectus]